MIDNVLNNCWGDWLSEEAIRALLLDIKHRLSVEDKLYKVFPSKKVRLRALDLVCPASVKVVILGQDPYHGDNQANGLAFSVPEGVPVPPSLRNIFKEIERDMGIPAPSTGDLLPWARQGVLLLNSVLTVRRGMAGSHKDIGWHLFTDKLIGFLSETTSGVVFMLWGSPAHTKERLIDGQKHLVLKSVHPSPLSAYRGFMGCGHFTAANRYLVSVGKSPIDWSLKSQVR